MAVFVAWTLSYSWEKEFNYQNTNVKNFKMMALLLGNDIFKV